MPCPNLYLPVINLEGCDILVLLYQLHEVTVGRMIKNKKRNLCKENPVSPPRPPDPHLKVRVWKTKQASIKLSPGAYNGDATHYLSFCACSSAGLLRWGSSGEWVFNEVLPYNFTVVSFLFQVKGIMSTPYENQNSYFQLQSHVQKEML
jgi:hypothetical protein